MMLILKKEKSEKNLKSAIIFGYDVLNKQPVQVQLSARKFNEIVDALRNNKKRFLNKEKI